MLGCAWAFIAMAVQKRRKAMRSSPAGFKRWQHSFFFRDQTQLPLTFRGQRPYHHEKSLPTARALRVKPPQDTELWHPGNARRTSTRIFFTSVQTQNALFVRKHRSTGDDACEGSRGRTSRASSVGSVRHICSLRYQRNYKRRSLHLADIR